MRAAIGSLERLLVGDVQPGDSHDERIRKATLVLGASLISVLAVVWTGTYLALGLPLSAAIPLTYQVATVVTVVFLRTTRFQVVCVAHLALMLVLPFLLQWSLGGFVESSAVSVWAFVSPLCAAMFFGARAAVPWFLAFLALTLVSALVDGSLPSRADEIPEWLALAFFVVNFAGVSTTAFVLVQHFLRALAHERERSERLLLNILPRPVAERLKATGETIADAADEVTVLFADLVGFTAVADRTEPADVVELLNEVFTAFDDLVDESGLEKIKTIGDGYMVAAGIPAPRSDHAEAAAELALAFARTLADLPGAARAGLRLRIGMDSGPVVAGVIGRRKFSYDLWGDTVNTASRMQSHAEPGEIQVTERTRARLGEGFELEARDLLEVKGKGSMRTYVLHRRAGKAPESTHAVGEPVSA
ncbi:MAG TPA: adenylate/guanylate cyclase domain-containing protein [Gaiellaceae bacterium]|nr:adenylate/guanylate cyclase domain-containing protein [Gaiellaceae bacterium]